MPAWRAVWDHKLPNKIILRNLWISRTRSLVGHPMHPLENVPLRTILVTKVQRVRVKTYFTAMCYNLMRARHLDRMA